MPKLDVRRDDFEDGVLPQICVATGAAADRPYRIELTWSPSWAWLLILAGPLGWLAMVLTDQIFRRTASGYVPYADAYHQLLLRRRRTALRALAAGLVAVGNGVVALVALDQLRGFGVVLIGAGLLAAIVGGVLAIDVPGSLKGSPDSSGRWIRLHDVHPAFAQAYLAQEDRRRQARRAEAIEPYRVR